MARSADWTTKSLFDSKLDSEANATAVAARKSYRSIYRLLFQDNTSDADAMDLVKTYLDTIVSTANVVAREHRNLMRPMLMSLSLLAYFLLKLEKIPFETLIIKICFE